ncbi:ABC transporter permease [Mycolicibacterium stellerae]|uniref:ABC transporter permease n=1 Tax=Mycolicibacterium stellerae TaxID=2358193 RepID=UPI000F0BCC6E|nr:ABC transporter permease [Mycolicibacterium stellerae]
MPNTVTADRPQDPATDTAPPVQRKRRRAVLPALRLLGLRLLFLLAALALWQGGVELGIIDPFYVSEPTAVLSRLSELVFTQQLYSDIAFTLQNTLVGFAISAVAGVGTACLFYKVPLLQKIVDPYILALYSTPRLALAPLFIIWFGIGPASKIALVVSLCYFVMLLNTYSGLMNVDKRLINQVKMMGGGDWFVFRKVSLPASVPWVLAGTRVGMGFALMGAVVGELIISEHGLGLRLSRASGLFDTTTVFAYLVVVAVLGMVIDQLLRVLEKSLAGWGITTAV